MGRRAVEQQLCLRALGGGAVCHEDSGHTGPCMIRLQVFLAQFTDDVSDWEYLLGVPGVVTWRAGVTDWCTQ